MEYFNCFQVPLYSISLYAHLKLGNSLPTRISALDMKAVVYCYPTTAVLTSNNSVDAENTIKLKSRNTFIWLAYISNSDDEYILFQFYCILFHAGSRTVKHGTTQFKHYCRQVKYIVLHASYTQDCKTSVRTHVKSDTAELGLHFIPVTIRIFVTWWLHNTWPSTL